MARLLSSAASPLRSLQLEKGFHLLLKDAIKITLLIEDKVNEQKFIRFIFRMQQMD